MSTTRPDGKAYVNPLAQDQRKLKRIGMWKTSDSVAYDPDPVVITDEKTSELDALVNEIAGLEAFQTLAYEDGKILRETRYKLQSSVNLKRDIKRVLTNYALKNYKVLATKFENSDSVLICVQSKEATDLSTIYKGLNDQTKEPLGVRKPF